MPGGPEGVAYDASGKDEEGRDAVERKHDDALQEVEEDGSNPNDGDDQAGATAESSISVQGRSCAGAVVLDKDRGDCEDCCCERNL